MAKVKKRTKTLRYGASNSEKSDFYGAKNWAKYSKSKKKNKDIWKHMKSGRVTVRA